MSSTDTIYEKILKDRGLSKGEIEEFLNPEYNEEKGGMYDVGRMKDIDKACVRIWQAIDAGEKICIYADYDADGVPGATILYDFFKKIGYQEHVSVMIPHRHKDGFGLHNHLIDEVVATGAKLMITIDLGISNVEQVAHANSLGLDVIITDHHLPHDELPAAFAILNPKQSDCGYVEKMLCGTGVIYKLIHRLVGQARKKGYVIAAGWEKWLLDLVGLATISDMVPLVGENRVFAQFGLRVLQKNKRLGLQCLLSKLKLNARDLQEDDIGFSISPCINAASRMSHAFDAFHLLSSDNSVDAMKRAKGLVLLNKSRKAKAQSLVEAADAKVLSCDTTRGIMIVGDVEWSPTLVGPVASNLVRQFQQPSFVYGCEDGEMFRGSCRSVPGVSLVEIMSHMPEGFFTEFGGHAMAGGFAFEKEKIDVFEETLYDAFCKWTAARVGGDIVNVDEGQIYGLTHDRVNDMFVSDLGRLKPFGMGNEKPLFKIRDVSLRSIKKFGKKQEHVEFMIENFVSRDAVTEKAKPDFLADAYMFADTYKKTSPVRYISFFSDQSHHDARVDTPCDILGYIEESFFLGKREIRVRVEKIIYK